jgi:hypothetical protein
MTRDFHIGDIISAATRVLVSPRGIEGVCDILRFMSGQSVFMHRVPLVLREAGPVLLRQHPKLAPVFAEAEGVTPENWRQMLDGWVARYGEMLPIEPFTGTAAIAPPTGIFRDHSCWKCLDGKKACVAGNPRQCDYPHARND